MIGILDVDIGNLKSLSNAIFSLGFDFELVREADRFDDLTHLLIPGVGAYSTAMHHIGSRGMRDAIIAFAASARPVLGICLGMQLLSSSGDEGGMTQGLGIVRGRVVRLEPDGGLRLPHIGWNTVQFVCEHPVFRRVKNARDFYFVHSYHFASADAGQTLAISDYGGTFAAVVGTGNVLGFQFHPEKSQANGLKLLENFCAWDGAC